MIDALSGGVAGGVHTGPIDIDMRADTTMLASRQPGGAALDATIFAPRGNPVRHVFVNGEYIVRNGAHRLRAIASERFREIAAGLAAEV